MSSRFIGGKLMQRIRGFKGYHALGLPADFRLLDYAQLKG